MALWLRHDRKGWIRVLSNPHGEKWNDEPEMTHVVFVAEDGTHYDIRGAQMPDEIAHHFGLSNSDWLGRYHPVGFWEDYVGEDDEFPLYGDEEDMRRATAIIEQYPDIYGIA